MKKMYMHQTTFDYLKKKILDGHKPLFPTLISGQMLSFVGIDISINNYLSPTIDEPTGWIFPKHKFYSYGPEDLEWCKYAGIGRQGRGFIPGDIVGESPISLNKFFTPIKPTVFNPFK